MAVDPDEIMIFKLRGMKTKQKMTFGFGRFAKQPQQKPAKAVEEKRAEATQMHGAEATQGHGAEAMEEQGAEAAQEYEEVAPEITEMPEKQPELSAEDVARLRQLEILETMATQYTAEEAFAKQTTVKEGSTLTRLTGVLFLINAIVLAYFIYPETVFILKYVEKVGIGSFMSTLKLDYGIDMVNVVLVILSALTGLQMFTKFGNKHMVGGAVGSMFLLAASFEYLNSNQVYLLIVSVLAFFGVVALSYSRMSSVRFSESEGQKTEGVVWPKIENF